MNKAVAKIVTQQTAFVQPRSGHTVLTIIDQHKAISGAFFDNISAMFELGCHMADYQHICREGDLIAGDDEAATLFGNLQDMTFMNLDQQVLDAGDSVGWFDQKNMRMAFIVVIAPGQNLVYFTRTAIDNRNTEIDMLAGPAVRRAHRIEQPWKQGNTFAKVALTWMFGYDFDDADNEVIIPDGILPNVARTAHDSALEVTEANS